MVHFKDLSTSASRTPQHKRFENLSDPYNYAYFVYAYFKNLSDPFDYAYYGDAQYSAATHLSFNYDKYLFEQLDKTISGFLQKMPGYQTKNQLNGHSPEQLSGRLR